MAIQQTKTTEIGEMIDISNLYLCLYNDGKVGIFERTIVEVTKASGDIPQTEVYSCFIGREDLEEKHIGIRLDEIKGLETRYGSCPIETWQPSGLGLEKGKVKYTADCRMYGALNFKHAYERTMGKSLEEQLVTREMISIVLKSGQKNNNAYAFKDTAPNPVRKTKVDFQ